MKQQYEEDWPKIAPFIKYLIISTKDFIVFIDKELDLDWETTETYDENNSDSSEHNAILNEVAVLESIPSEHLAEGVRMSFKRMLGEGVARSFKHDYLNAETILIKAKDYIQQRNIEQSRYWYLSSSGYFGLGCGFFALIFWVFRNIGLATLGEIGFYSLLAALSGGIGALLSIILRIGKSQLDSSSGQRLHILEGVYRIIAGAISGFFISFLVKLGIILPIFTESSKTHIAMLAVGLVAGASERWVPSLISQFEEKKFEITQEEKQKS